MKTEELLSVLECIGGLSLSREFCDKHGAYDNSGVIVDCGEEITGVLFSLDLSENAVKEAKKRRFNAIVTHHPAIYTGLKEISVFKPDSALIAECIRWGITVISMHLNFDSAPEGIDYELMRGLGGDAGNTMIKLSGGAYGRAFDVAKTSVKEYLTLVSRNFNTERILYYSGNDRDITKVASFCGAGCDDAAIAFAEKEQADLFVSSDMKHHQITALLARGISVLILTHYAAENYGFNKIYQKITDGLNVPAAYFCDAALL